jgi:hypothetical protein
LPRWIKPVGLGANRVRIDIASIISGQPDQGKTKDTLAYE